MDIVKESIRFSYFRSAIDYFDLHPATFLDAVIHIDNTYPTIMDCSAILYICSSGNIVYSITI